MLRKVKKMKYFNIIFLVNIFLSNLLAGGNSFLFNCLKSCPQDRVLYYLQSNNLPIDTQDSHNDTLLHYAVRYKKYRIISYLVSQGADVAALGANNQTPVDIAISNNDTTAMQYLMNSSSFTRVKDNGRIKYFLKKHKNLYSLYQDNFEDDFMGDFDKETDNFQEEVNSFSDKIRKKSMYDKKRKIYTRSHTKVDKRSKNNGNIDITIK